MNATNIHFLRSFFSQSQGLFLILLFLIWIPLVLLLIFFGNLSGVHLLNLIHSEWLNDRMFWLAQFSDGFIVTSGVVIALAKRSTMSDLLISNTLKNSRIRTNLTDSNNQSNDSKQ